MRSFTYASIGLALLLAACNPVQKDTAEEANEAVDGVADVPPSAQEEVTELGEGLDPAQKNLLLGKAFLNENKNAQGVQISPSGLQYKVLNAGPEEGANPYPGQFVCVHYQGTSIAGDEFDSSFSRGVPSAFPSDRLIKGWVEALGMMRAGDEWMLYVPSDLAYGANGTLGGPIGPNETLVFKINLIRLLDITVEEYRQTYAVNRQLDCSKAP